MSDLCEVKFDKYAEREINKLNKREPHTVAALIETIKHVIDLGWARCTENQLIKELKVLDEETGIGEIRHLGVVSYRMIFYWNKTKTSHEITITIIARKSKLKKNELNDFIALAEKRR